MMGVLSCHANRRTRSTDHFFLQALSFAYFLGSSTRPVHDLQHSPHTKSNAFARVPNRARAACPVMLVRQTHAALACGQELVGGPCQGPWGFRDRRPTASTPDPVKRGRAAPTLHWQCLCFGSVRPSSCACTRRTSALRSRRRTFWRRQPACRRCSAARHGNALADRAAPWRQPAWPSRVQAREPTRRSGLAAAWTPAW